MIRQRNYLSTLFAGVVFPVLLSFVIHPVKAASALAAWAVRSDGVLQLRTSAGASLKAFFQSASDGKGDRVWIDIPGELIKPRTILGNGPIRQIRLGKPSEGKTRLVLEFRPYVSIDPLKLKLVGTSPNHWELTLSGMPTHGLRRIGEGNVSKSLPTSLDRNFSRSNNFDLNRVELPVVPRNKYRVVIDPGHGGPDPGAVGIGGLRETNVVLDVSHQVERLLSSKGVQVTMTRRREVDLDLPPRVAIANRLRADAFVSIHANASRGFRRDVNGLETFYYVGYRGRSLAANIQKEILKVSPGSPDRGVRRGRYFVIRKTNMPAALVEIGFLTGRLDAARLAQAGHRTRLAYAITKGILNYLKEAG